jgi:hypothetical protein
LRVKDSFPKFYWTLRDFFLDLKHDTPSNYLEKSLTAQSGVENVSKNKAREYIKRNLKNRHCFALPCPSLPSPPLSNPSKTHPPPPNLSFHSQIPEMRLKILRDVSPKTWCSKELDTLSFLSLTSLLLTQLNTPNTPNLTQITDHIFDSKIDQFRTQVIDDFQSKFISKLEQKLPMDTESMFTDFFREQNEC